MSVIGTEILARAYHASAVSPVAVPAWGIPPAADSSSASCKDGDMSEGSSTASSSASLALYDYRREAEEVGICVWMCICVFGVFFYECTHAACVFVPVCVYDMMLGFVRA